MNEDHKKYINEYIHDSFRTVLSMELEDIMSRAFEKAPERSEIETYVAEQAKAGKWIATLEGSNSWSYRQFLEWPIKDQVYAISSYQYILRPTLLYYGNSQRIQELEHLLRIKAFCLEQYCYIPDSPAYVEQGKLQ